MHGHWSTALGALGAGMARHSMARHRAAGKPSGHLTLFLSAHCLIFSHLLKTEPQIHIAITQCIENQLKCQESVDWEALKAPSLIGM